MSSTSFLVSRISDVPASYVDSFEVFKTDRPFYEIGNNHFRVNADVNFAGFKGSDFQSPEHVYELIHESDRQLVYDQTMRLIDHINAKMSPELFTCKSYILFRVKGKNGKVYKYCRECGVNGYSKNGEMAFNYTFMRDVTWMSL